MAESSWGRSFKPPNNRLKSALRRTSNFSTTPVFEGPLWRPGILFICDERLFKGTPMVLRVWWILVAESTTCGVNLDQSSREFPVYALHFALAVGLWFLLQGSWSAGRGFLEKGRKKSRPMWKWCALTCPNIQWRLARPDGKTPATSQTASNLGNKVISVGN